jgi:hypothetical protein
MAGKLIGGVEPSGRPEKPSAQAIEAINKKLEETFLASFVEDIAYFPAKIKGEGMYVLTTGMDFPPLLLQKIGFDSEDMSKVKASGAAKWSVPPDVMEKVVPGWSQLTPEELTGEICAIKGHEYSTVKEMPKAGYPLEVENVKGTTSRTTFVEKDGDKNDIEMRHQRRYQIAIPERIMHKALGMEEGRKLS